MQKTKSQSTLERALGELRAEQQRQDAQWEQLKAAFANLEQLPITSEDLPELDLPPVHEPSHWVLRA